MKIKTIMVAVLAFVLSATLNAHNYKYQEVPGDKMQTRIYTLDNGLKVYLSVNKEKPRIQTYIAVKTGSRNDPAQTTGLAHYLEHLMFKGTTHFGTSNPIAEAPLLDSIENRYEQYRRITNPAARKACYHKIDSLSQLAARYNIPNEYDKLMTSIGSIGTNAYTSNDVTCYTENIPSNEVENWAKIQADRFQNMVIRGFHTELEAVYEEYNIGLSNDGNKVWDALSAKLFPHHPYGTQTTIGTQEHLKNPSIVNIKKYFKNYYCPNNVAICMSGDFDPDKVVDIIDKYFGSWKANSNLSSPVYAPVKNLTAPADTTVWGQEAANVALAWKFAAGGTLQADTLSIIADMLSNGKAGLMDLDLDQQMKYLGGGAFSYPLAEYSSLILMGTPKEGQTLDEVKELLLGEIAKLKSGDFSEDLITSVVNNQKLDYYKALESNEKRADMFVTSFINDEPWSQVVDKFNRISHITKQQIVDFANRHLGNGYACVYKKEGEDKTQKKIEKPEITPIPSNRDKQSDFVTAIAASKVQPIQPRFVNFDRDLSKLTTKKGLPVLYVKNADNGLFTLSYHYEMGTAADKRLPIAASYFDYLGTDKLSAEDVKKQFYKLACSPSIMVSDYALNITLTGLGDNMAQAMALLENVLANAKPDQKAYNDYVALIEKGRNDEKLDQRSNFRALANYGIYGSDYVRRKNMTNEELKQANPQELVSLIKGLKKYRHTVLYCGPMEQTELVKTVDKYHKTTSKLSDVPAYKEFVETQTPANEIVLAPYDAKNIYMEQYHCDNRSWNADMQPVIDLFNEYYGGGMNAVVFQELRETRGLAYSAFAEYATPWRKGHPEYGYTYIISQNDKMMDCINTFRQILDSIPQTQTAFDLAKQSLAKRIATQRTTKFAIINKYLSARQAGIDYDLNEKVYNALPKLTMADIVKFEQQTWARKPFRTLILGDEKNLDLRSLEKIAPIKRVTTEEIFGY